MSRMMFVNPATGFFVGTSRFGITMRTNDSTNSYMITRAADSTVFFDCYFSNSSTGLICGYRRASWMIFKTEDSAYTWRVVSTGNGSVASMSFPNNQTGYGVCGTYGYILKTVDSGNNWQVLTAPTRNNMLSIFFINSQTGWISGWGGSIYKTVDGAATWQSKSLPYKLYLEKIKFVNAATGFVIGRNGVIYKTVDGASTWQQLNTGFSVNYYNLCFTPSGKIYVSGSLGTIICSTDGGTSWQKQLTPAQCNLYSIQMLSETFGYAAGTGENIWNTSNGGITGFGQAETTIPKNFGLEQNYPNPFNPVTTIHYSLMKSTHVKITVMDLLGREVRVLVDENESAGTYESIFDGSGLSSGIYLYQIETREFSDIKKMILIK